MSSVNGWIEQERVRERLQVCQSRVLLLGGFALTTKGAEKRLPLGLPRSCRGHEKCGEF